MKHIHSLAVFSLFFGTALFAALSPIGAQEAPPVPDGGENAAINVAESETPIDPEVSFENFVTRDEFDAQIEKLAWKKGDYTFTPYGYLWVNAALNSQESVSDSFVLYTLSPDTIDASSSAVDARTSRIGMTVDGPGFPCNSDIKLKGVVEVDFQGTVNGTRNKGGLQLRKAFVELTDPKKLTKLEFGQNWETISPLAPQMLNYLPLGFCGNIGYRRAQMRYEKGHVWTPDLRTVWTLGIADSFAGDFTSTSCVSANSGGWPMVQGRFAVSLGDCSRDHLPITVGLSGHIGEQTYAFSSVAGSYLATRETKQIKTWSANLDVDVPITKKFRFQGEYFNGCDLSSTCGGINQGVDLYKREGIRSQGGWLSLHSQLTEKLINNTGAGIDHPFSDDLVGNCTPTGGWTNARTKNEMIFTNFLYQWNAALMTGLEFGYMKTSYRRANVTNEEILYAPMRAGENFRVDFAVQYLF